MKRMISLDALRGYALVCIMLDHMPASILREVTLANFVVFDAAELFVLLSGFLIGIVWLNVEEKQGRGVARRRFVRRAFEVWRALVIGGVLLALLSAILLAFEMRHTAVWNQYAIWVIENPLGYVGTLMTMWMQPNLLDVLAVYVLLIASTPLLVPVMLRWPLVFAICSVTLWWFAPTLNAMIPNQRGSGFLFNPFGWQMLFFTGVAMSLFRKQFMPVLLRYRLAVTLIAWGMFLFGAVLGTAVQFGQAGLPLRNALRPLYGTVDKWSLDGTRYLAIVAASWLVAVPLARIIERIAASRPGEAMQQIGRGGLWSFIACVLLSILGDALQINPADQPVLQRLAVDLWVVMALWGLAIVWLEYGAPRQKARKAAKAAKALQARAAKAAKTAKTLQVPAETCASEPSKAGRCPPVQVRT
ncbi:OpgC domain-containing protein [Paracoccus onubensis]|uniref:OpgC domain-containing protein n=1 Tax=Paracoccus onubensis TaxID=1675788 RepID=UPI002731B6E5|nr:OpgC domain-containing protein [Paracoccus onubensis]MDP0928293.1 OpgC domain-containing protein [Paracoccus onubensis]